MGEGIRYVNEAEAQVVRDMFTWLVSDNMTVNGITQRLRSLSIPTPAGSAFWIRQTVYRMLVNPAYIGKSYAFTKRYVEPKTRRGPNTKRKKTGVIARPRDQWIEIPNATPAIVDIELFEAAQAILKRNKELDRRNSKREYLLSGYIICARCGYRYQGYVKKWAKPKPYEMRYYRCGKSQGIVAPERCRNKQLPANRIEAAVWQEINQVLSHPDIMLAELRRMREEAREAAQVVKTWTADLAMVETKLKNLEKQKNRIYYAFKIVGDEAKFRADIAAYQADKKALENQSNDLTQKLEAYAKTQVDIEGVKAACDLVKKNLKTLTYADKRLALEALNIRVKVDENNITIQGNIPVLNESIENPSTR